MSLEETYHNAQIPFQDATLDSDEHFPLKVRDMQMKATYFFFHMFNHAVKCTSSCFILHPLKYFSTPLINYTAQDISFNGTESAQRLTTA